MRAMERCIFGKIEVMYSNILIQDDNEKGGDSCFVEIFFRGRRIRWKDLKILRQDFNIPISYKYKKP